MVMTALGMMLVTARIVGTLTDSLVIDLTETLSFR
jgi:hypothetical protein